MEKLILKFKLPLIGEFSIINAIVSFGYRETGNKFSVNFNGSKGYLSNIEITCEGTQKERNNIIWIENLLTKKGRPKNTMINIFYSDENGIRIGEGADKPRIIKKDEISETIDAFSEYSDLPF